MKTWAVKYHYSANPMKILAHRILTGDEYQDVIEYLQQKKASEGDIVLHYAVRERQPVAHEHTCTVCGQTRVEYVHEKSPMHPGAFGLTVEDRSHWRVITTDGVTQYKEPEAP